MTNDPTWEIHKDALSYAAKAEKALLVNPTGQHATATASVLALLAIERRLHWLGLQAERDHSTFPNPADYGGTVYDSSEPHLDSDGDA